MKKVLIVEDDTDTLEMLGYIAAQAGVEVVLRSAILPVAEVERIGPNLVLLDYWIAGKCGAELCLKIKQHPATAGIPVIVLSGINDLSQVAKDYCADGSIAKPFDIVQVEEVLQAYLV